MKKEKKLNNLIENLQKNHIKNARSFISDFMHLLPLDEVGNAKLNFINIPTKGVCDIQTNDEYLFYAGGYDGCIYYNNGTNEEMIDIDDLEDYDVLAIAVYLGTSPISFKYK